MSPGSFCPVGTFLGNAVSVFRALGGRIEAALRGCKNAANNARRLSQGALAGQGAQEWHILGAYDVSGDDAW